MFLKRKKNRIPKTAAEAGQKPAEWRLGGKEGGLSCIASVDKTHFRKSSARARDHQSLSSSERIEGTIWQEANEEGRNDKTRGGHTHTHTGARKKHSSENLANLKVTRLYSFVNAQTHTAQKREYLLVSKCPLLFHDFLTTMLYSFFHFSFLLK